MNVWILMLPLALAQTSDEDAARAALAIAQASVANKPLAPIQPTKRYPTYAKALDQVRGTDKLIVLFVGKQHARETEGSRAGTSVIAWEPTFTRVNGVTETDSVAAIKRGKMVWWPSVGGEKAWLELVDALHEETEEVRQAPSFFEVTPRPSAKDAPRIADDKDAGGSLPPWPKILEGMTEYKPTQWTQSIYNQGEKTDRVQRTVTEEKWHQSGGMLGVHGFKSTLYKLTPAAPSEWLGGIWVRHQNASSGQYETGMKRSYANGTRFIDRLRNDDGEDFEVRLRFKSGGKWRAKVIFSDHDKRPKGYAGLQQSCASCHDEAGTGIYGNGLVPGGDTVISDELPWHLLNGTTPFSRNRLRNFN